MCWPLNDPSRESASDVALDVDLAVGHLPAALRREREEHADAAVDVDHRVAPGRAGARGELVELLLDPGEVLRELLEQHRALVEGELAERRLADRAGVFDDGGEIEPLGADLRDLGPGARVEHDLGGDLTGRRPPGILHVTRHDGAGGQRGGNEECHDVVLPVVEAAAALASEVSLRDHVAQQLRWGETVAEGGLQVLGDAQPHVEPDDVGGLQRADRMLVAEHHRRVDVRGGWRRPPRPCGSPRGRSRRRGGSWRIRGRPAPGSASCRARRPRRRRVRPARRWCARP